ncbi:hypothetical protein Ciccas_006498 [Cichlidogyrus casuarinus]|uniref:Uncharacterized protein n=1 Tax=Cichlidogyrus casuarinus TaxID=1844966 RepID=A0ABD2Q5R8_9PLAT
MATSPRHDEWQYMELSRLTRLGLGARRLQKRENSTLTSHGSTLEDDSTSSLAGISFVSSSQASLDHNTMQPFSTLKSCVTCGYYFDCDRGHYKEKIDVQPVNVVAWRPPKVVSITELRDSSNKERLAPKKKVARRMK